MLFIKKKKRHHPLGFIKFFNHFQSYNNTLKIFSRYQIITSFTAKLSTLFNNSQEASYKILSHLTMKNDRRGRT